MRRLWWLVAVLMLVSACGGGDGGEAQPEACEEELSDAASKPKICAPAGDPPAKIVIEDVKQGDGAEVPAGATVTVQYVGVSWSTGEEFDSSWDRGEPATFPLSGVIKGWQEGIPGMKVGGRRKLTIPADFAYGAAPPPGSGIGANETLIFVIDLLEVKA